MYQAKAGGIPQDLGFDKWLSVGRQLSDMHSLSAWCQGDWLVYGEAAYAGRYRDATEQTSLDYQTLRAAFLLAGNEGEYLLEPGHEWRVSARATPGITR